ncbi:MAG: glycosyltransferase [Cyclobacteriaceae bacterium]
MLISVIIPTLNEEFYLPRTIENTFLSAEDPQDLEVLVVDAGSSDNTLRTIEKLGVRIFSKPEFALKKFQSLNYGIEQAKGETLLFLDADTTLPKAFDKHIRKTLEDKAMVGGAFEFSFEKPDWKLYLLQMINRIRYRIEQTYYGDQAVFCRKSVVKKIGGYPEKTLMESAFFCNQLLKAGQLKLIKKPIKTSPRRFNENGFFKVFWFDFTMWIRFVLNLPVEEYGKKYWGLNLKSDG